MYLSWLTYHNRQLVLANIKEHWHAMSSSYINSDALYGMYPSFCKATSPVLQKLQKLEQPPSEVSRGVEQPRKPPKTWFYTHHTHIHFWVRCECTITSLTVPVSTLHAV